MRKCWKNRIEALEEKSNIRTSALNSEGHYICSKQVEVERCVMLILDHLGIELNYDWAPAGDGLKIVKKAGKEQSEKKAE